MEHTHAPVPSVRTLPLPGNRDVSLDEEVGHGRLSSVYAGSVEGERRVAVKVFNRLPHAGRHRVVEHLAHAMNAATCISDPRVVQVYDYDLARLEPFVVTELVDGGTLESIILAFERQNATFPHDVAVLVGIRVAEALEAALRCRLPDGTSAPLVHGCLSARDVFVSWEGDVKVGDFGINAATMLSTSVHRVDPVRLAPIAPEVMAGEAADECSDVFSLGILLRRMLTGPRFTPSTTTEEAIDLTMRGIVPKSPNEPSILAPLRSVLKRATHANRGRRYAHAGELAKDLRAVAALIGVPEAPAFIARAVHDALAPELTATQMTESEDEPSTDGEYREMSESMVEVEELDVPVEEDTFASTRRSPSESGIVRNWDDAPTIKSDAPNFEDLDPDER